MTLLVKAIDTTYRGVPFRSRLEARWAIFLDGLGLEWEYEPECFTDGDISYTPDFFVPALDRGGAYVEVKPTQDYDHRKIHLATAEGMAVYVAIGQPGTSSGVCHDCQMWQGNHSGMDVCYGQGEGDCSYLWCRCEVCKKVGIEFDAWSDRIPCRCPLEDRQRRRKEYNPHWPEFHNAVQASKRRFWR